MRTLQLIALGSLVSLSSVSLAGPGGGGCPLCSSGEQVTETASGLDQATIEMLVAMREEEKLARDVYLTLGEKWDEGVFGIAESEKRHLSAMKGLLDRFGIDELCHYKQSSKLNNALPLIALADQNDATHIKAVKEKGIDHFITFPFEIDDLSQKIHDVYVPSRKREFRRYSVPGLEASIHVPNRRIRGRAINISLDGILLELDFEGNYSDLFRVNTLSLYFPKEFSGVTIEDILCRVFRISVVGWNHEGLPDKVEVVCQFTRDHNNGDTSLAAIMEIVRLQYQTFS